MAELDPEAQRTLVEALRAPACYPHPVEQVELIETHISYVLLAGEFAYKIKKPLDLGFLDFRGLDRRRYYCDEELRLNRRLAPQLYLRRVGITGSPQAPRLDGPGAPIEYAVQMRRFPQRALLPALAERGELRLGLMDELARRLAAFHAASPRLDPATDYGQPEQIARFARDNLLVLRRELGPGPGLASLEPWTEAQLARLAASFAQRRDGLVEGHGDLHLANMAWLDGQLVIFDGIEFDPQLRWLDPMSELAFALMDLDWRGLGRHARRLRSAYLEQRGDYAGLRVLTFYQVYRALVRAKIAALRAAQLGEGPARERALAESADLIALARRYTEPGRPRLVLTHGYAGSGKSTAAQQLVDEYGCIRLRSDIERKRLYGLAPESRSGSGLGEGLYSAAAGIATYQRLLSLTREVLESGACAVVDAAFLQRRQRAPFIELAEAMGCPWRILTLQAPEALLAQRVGARAAAGQDASEADQTVLAWQREAAEPLEAGERARALALGPEALNRARLAELFT